MKKIIRDKNTWHKFNDGWFTYFVNTLTGEKKFELEDGDIEVDGYDYLDDLYRGDEE